MPKLENKQKNSLENKIQNITFIFEFKFHYKIKKNTIPALILFVLVIE